MAKSEKPQSWKALQGTSKALREKLEGWLTTVEDLVGSEELDAISAAEVLRDVDRAWSDLLPAIGSRTKAALSRIESIAAEQRETFESRLQRALKVGDHEVFGGAGTLIVAGIVHVEVNTKRWTVDVNGQRLESLLPNEIARIAHEEVARLRAEVQGPEKFLAELQAAYDREVGATGGKPGQQLPLLDLLPVMALARQSKRFCENPVGKGFKDYPVEVFRAELYGMLAAGVNELRGRRFRQAPGADTKGALFMLVPALGRSAHVGRIWFEDSHAG